MYKKLHTAAPIMFMSLLVIGTIFGTILSVKPASAAVNQPPLLCESAGEVANVYISPEKITGLGVGETFTVTVGVSGLSGKNLYGFDIYFTWNINALQYVSHEVKVPVETCSDGILHQPIIEVMKNLDTSAGTLWLAYASMLPAQPFNENGVIFTITFVLLEPTDNPYAIEHAILANSNGNVIPTQNYQNGEISIASSDAGGMEACRVLRNEKWLEWWIEVMWL